MVVKLGSDNFFLPQSVCVYWTAATGVWGIQFFKGGLSHSNWEQYSRTEQSKTHFSSKGSGGNPGLDWLTEELAWTRGCHIIRNGGGRWGGQGLCEQRGSLAELKCPWFIWEWVRFSQTKAQRRHPLPDGARELSESMWIRWLARRQFGHFPDRLG